MVRAFLRADTHIDLQLPDNAVEATFNKEQVSIS